MNNSIPHNNFNATGLKISDFQYLFNNFREIWKWKIWKFSILYFIFAITSCSGTKPNEHIVLDIEKAIKNKKEIRLSEIAATVQWIELDTTSAPFIGIIQKIIEVDNQLIILGKEGLSGQNGIHIFDVKGKYIRTLGQFGKGPCEYMQINDMFYNAATGKIMLLSSNNKYLVQFDLEGNCYESKVETKSAINFYYDNNIYFLHRPSNELYFNAKNNFNQLLATDSSSTIHARLHPCAVIKSTYLNPFIEEAVLTKFDNKILYYIPLDDTIYQVDATNERPFFVFDHGSNAFPTDFKWDMEGSHKANSMNKSRITDMKQAYPFLFFSYRYATAAGLLLLHEAKLINCFGENNPGIVDDIDGLENITDFLDCGNCIIQPFEPYLLMEAKPNKYGFSPEVEKLIGNMHENNSIVLRRIKLKESLDL